MATKDELRQMIMSFRVSELHILLQFAGRNKSGRKEELQARAVELLQLNSSPVQLKIRELHKKYHTSSIGGSSSAPPGVVNAMHPASGSGYPRGSVAASQGGAAATNASRYLSTGLMSGAAPAPAGMLSSAAPILPVSAYNKQYLNPNAAGSIGYQYPTHPQVRLKHLPFFDVLHELLQPSTLIPQTPGNRCSEAQFCFQLTPQQANSITTSRYTRPGARFEEFRTQIQLRFCILDTSSEQEDAFPTTINVKVNNKPVNLPNPIPTNKPNTEPKRPSRPVNITPYCKLSPTVTNHIYVSWASEMGKAYCIASYVVNRLSSDELLERLKKQGMKNPEHTKALIKEKLRDDDMDIGTESLRVSLMCPLGKMHMQVPCRASTCTHLQCFDASLYLQMNEKKPTWICPVCDRPAPYSLLCIDGLFFEVAKKNPELTEIELHEDGSWTPPSGGKKDVSVVPDIQKVEAVKPEPRAPQPKAPAAAGDSAPPEEPSIIILDLSDSDSEDANPPSKRPALRGPATAATNGSSNAASDRVSPSPAGSTCNGTISRSDGSAPRGSNQSYFTPIYNDLINSGIYNYGDLLSMFGGSSEDSGGVFGDSSAPAARSVSPDVISID